MKKLHYIISILGLLLFASCSTDESEKIIDETLALEENSEEIKLTPKILATIKIADDVDLIFRSEEDGVVYEAVGDANTFNGLGELRDLSTLEIFMALTSQNTPVPKDLITIDDNPNSKSKAAKRGTVEKHFTVIKSLRPLTPQKYQSQYCSVTTPSYYHTYDYSGKYMRVYYNYRTGSQNFTAPGSRFYSSGKSGADRCKRVEFEISNCYDPNYDQVPINVYQEYKVLGLYSAANPIIIEPGYCRIYRKTFTSKLRRRTIIYSGWGETVGGFVRYSNYKY